LVYNLALQYTQNAEDAEELSQDVFLKVHDKLAGFRHDATLKTWIYRITVNQSLDYIRAKKSQKRWSLLTAKSILQDGSSEDIPHFQHPGILLEDQESLELLFRCINKLPDNQKTALILLKIDDLSQIETAEIMNISPKAVESLFQRAKKKLNELLIKTKDHAK
jgi:RNA polymerase sigma factor (sigma-70 family)